MTIDEENLRQIFNSMDTNHDGMVSFEELKHALKDCFGIQNMLDILRSCDANDDGVLSFEEFSKAMAYQITESAVPKDPVNKQEPSVWQKIIERKFQKQQSNDQVVLSREDILSIFNDIDINKDGSVEISEIMQYLQEAHWIDEEVMEAIVTWADDADRDLDGRISFEEFSRAMTAR